MAYIMGILAEFGKIFFILDQEPQNHGGVKTGYAKKAYLVAMVTKQVFVLVRVDITKWK